MGPAGEADEDDIVEFDFKYSLINCSYSGSGLRYINLLDRSSIASALNRKTYEEVTMANGDFGTFSTGLYRLVKEMSSAVDTKPCLISPINITPNNALTNSYSYNGFGYGVQTMSSEILGGHCAEIDPHRSTEKIAQL